MALSASASTLNNSDAKLNRQLMEQTDTVYIMRTRESLASYWFFGAVCAAGFYGCATETTDATSSSGERNRQVAGGAGNVGNDGKGGATNDGLISRDAGAPAGPKLPAPPDVDWPYVHESIQGMDPAAKFSGDGSAFGGPELLYPLPNSVHAPNERQLTVQWSTSGSQTLFAVEFKGAESSYRFYVPCTKDDGMEEGSPSRLAANECAYKLPAEHLRHVGLSNGGQSVELRVLATSEEAGATVASSEPVEFQFAPEVIRGALYYWSTRDAGIFRAPFGAHQASIYIEASTYSASGELENLSETNSFACAGCHSVSRDGSRVAFVTGSGFPGGLQVVPSNDPTAPLIESTPSSEMYKAGTDWGNTPKPAEPYHSNAPVLSPDGKWVVNYSHTGVEVIEAATNKVTQQVGIGHELLDLDGTFVARDPAFSPDGNQVAFAATETLYTNVTWDASIIVMPFDKNEGKLGKSELIATPTANSSGLGFPSWTPDGKWLAFHHMPGTDRRVARVNASLFMVSSSPDGGPYTCPGPKCYHLANAQQGLENSPGYIRFTPFDMKGGSLVFLTFNTQIDYGAILRNSRRSPGPYDRVPQLWMAAVDLNKLESGEDASYAPVWVPLQSVEETNHYGYWTEKIICTSDAECGTCESCIDQTCKPDDSCDIK